MKLNMYKISASSSLHVKLFCASYVVHAVLYKLTTQNEKLHENFVLDFINHL